MDDLKQAIKYLKAARDLLEDEGKWTKKAFAKNSSGKKTKTYSPDACKFCAVGAVFKVSSATEDDSCWIPPKIGVGTTFDFLDDSFYAQEGQDISITNDKPSTKHIHVMMAYDFAILMAKDELRKQRNASVAYKRVK